MKHYFQTDEFKEKSKQTCLDKYGTEYAAQSDIVKQKIENTCLEKYGELSYVQTADFKEKRKKTLYLTYGVEYNSQTELYKNHYKKTCQEKYGCDYVLQSSKVKEQIAATNSDKYKHTCQIDTTENLQQRTENWLNTYNIMYNPSDILITGKQWERVQRKLSKDFTSSKYVFDKLKERFTTVILDYKDGRYPFPCDFYMPEKDLFIEFQSFVGHGKHPFNIHDENDVALLLYWAIKADEKPLNKRNKYLAYVHTWAERDPMKRECARKNNLNWHEFFSLEEFEKWFKTIL